LIESRIRWPVRIGMVGLTGWASSLAKGAARTPDVELVTGFARNPESRRTFSQDFGCKTADSYEALLADSRVEAVILGTPNHTHCEQTLQAARAGKHVFVEKPIANRLDEARAMIAACEEAGVVLFVGHNYRRRGEVRKLKSLVADGRLGHLIMVEGHNSHPGGLRLTPQSWRWYDETCPGGPLMQLGIHVYDALQYLAGRIRRVTALFAREVMETEIPDTTLTLLEFESGMLGYVGSAYAVPRTGYIAAYGTDAKARTEGDGPVYFTPREAVAPTQFAVGVVDTVAEEIAEFAACVRGERSPETGGPEAVSALKVVLAAIESRMSDGKAVEIE
jgi:predicted dehydrogenase